MSTTEDQNTNQNVRKQKKGKGERRIKLTLWEALHCTCLSSKHWIPNLLARFWTQIQLLPNPLWAEELVWWHASSHRSHFHLPPTLTTNTLLFFFTIHWNPGFWGESLFHSLIQSSSASTGSKRLQKSDFTHHPCKKTPSKQKACWNCKTVNDFKYISCNGNAVFCLLILQFALFSETILSFQRWWELKEKDMLATAHFPTVFPLGKKCS